jgi:hypothetical protein
MDHNNDQVNLENEVKLIAGAPEGEVKLLENTDHIQTFTNGSGCSVGILAYCMDLEGSEGALNLANALLADGRFGIIVLIDGDAFLPTAQYLLDNFDAVIAISRAFCGIPTPQNIADSAANALAGFAQGGGGVVLSAYGFSTCVGFGDAIFAAGLSPFQKVQCPDAIGEFEVDLNSVGPDPVCQCIFNGVTGPIVLQYPFFPNVVALSPGATLCAAYTNGMGFAAVNPAGNIIGLNVFPSWDVYLNQEDFRRIVANAVYCVCGQQPEPVRGVDFTKLI